MESDLRDALIAWQGGELPKERADELLARLRDDVEFRRAFAAEAWTLSLTRVAQAPDPRWLALQEELGLSPQAAEPANVLSFEQTVMDSVRSEPLRFVSAWWRRAAYGAMAASVALAGVLIALSLRPSRLEAKAGASILAVLVHSENAVWKGSAPARSSTLGAERLQLSAGRASLLFTSGVALDFEGPCDLQLVSVDRVICHQGKLRTNVPHGAEGFCVETPRGAVTDLGTELGISVALDGKTQVAVFEGQAEVSLQIPGQEGVRTALLNQHESAELLPTSGEIRTESSGAFLDAAKLQLPRLGLVQNYAQTILAAKPSHYWRLDRVQDGAIPNEVVGAPALHTAGSARIEPDESGRATALLSGRKTPGTLFLDEPWQKPESSYAVEMWFAADSIDQVALFALTAPEDSSRHIALVENGSKRPGHSAEAGVLRFLTRWPARARGGMNIYSKPLAFPYQWHHLVAQQRAGEMQLFLDGSFIGSAQTESFAGAIPAVLQFGCLSYRPKNGVENLQRVFSGRLAEIAIYDRLLTGDEIREHASLGGIGETSL